MSATMLRCEPAHKDVPDHFGTRRTSTPMTESRLSRIAIVLYEPQDPVNIAATVRAMKNMGVSTLRLVRPCAYDPVRLEGIAHDTWDLIDQHRALSTTSTPRSPTACASSASRRAAAPRSGRSSTRGAARTTRSSTPSDGRVGIVFGREDSGLPNEILDRIHAAVTIPTTDARLAQPRAGGAHRAVRAAPRRGRCHPHASAARARRRRLPTTDLIRALLRRGASGAGRDPVLQDALSGAHHALHPRDHLPRRAGLARAVAAARGRARGACRFLERTGRVERALPRRRLPSPAAARGSARRALPRHRVRRRRGLTAPRDETSLSTCLSRNSSVAVVTRRRRPPSR